MATVLIVDDEQSIRETLSEFLEEEGHAVVVAADAPSALSAVGETPPDVVVTDIVLPGVTGVTLLKQLRQHAPQVQVIMITGEPAVDTATEAVRQGAFDYLPKPVSRDRLKAVVASAARVKALADERARLEAENVRYREHLEEEVAEKTAALLESEEKYRTVIENAVEAVFVLQDGVVKFSNPSVLELTGLSEEYLRTTPFLEVIHPEDRAAAQDRHVRRLRGEALPDEYTFRIVGPDGEVHWAEIRSVRIDWLGRPATLNFAHDITERRRAEEALKEALSGTIEAIGLTTETRDPYTAGHQRRVTELAVAIAEELGFDERRIEAIRAAGLMHDIGKMAIPAEILSKPSALTDMEEALMQTHPQVAYDILKSVTFPWPLAQIVLQHHERIDGSGYPQGLRGDEILVEARVLAVADTVEAMASHRPYRAAVGIDAALKEIEDHRDTRYDPEIADACLRLFREGRFAFDDEAPSST
jgi:PAS domain S-box-containing protein/putative nucleotidyltransferase with HDIG domain